MASIWKKFQGRNSRETNTIAVVQDKNEHDDTDRTDANHVRSADTVHEEAPTPPVENKATGEQEDPLEFDPTAGYITGIPLYLIVLGITLAVLCVALDNAILATAIPTITTDFDSLDDVGWYGSSFLIAICALQPTAGKIFKYFTLKWSYMWFVFMFELGSLICAVSRNSPTLIIGRAVAGLGASGIFSGALTIVAVTIPLHLRPVYIGVVGSVMTISNVLGPILGGGLTQHASWRWCFWINLPCGGVTLVVLFFCFHPVPRATDGVILKEKVRQLDLLGLIAFIPAMVMLLLAIQWGGTKYAWRSARIIGLLVGAIGAIALFIVWEFLQGETAGIPPRIATQRSVIFASIVAFLLFGALNAGLYFLPIWFQVILGVDPTSSGIHLMPSVLASFVTGPVVGLLITKIGWYNPFFFFGASLLAIGAGLFSTFTVHSGAGQWIGYQVLFGAGAGVGMQVGLVAVMAALPPNDVSIGTAVLVFSQFLGGSMFICIANSVFRQQLLKKLIVDVPNVDPQLIIAAGAAGVRKVISGVDLPSAIAAYNGAVRSTFLVCGVGAGIAVFAALGVEWKNVKGKSMMPIGE